MTRWTNTISKQLIRDSKQIVVCGGGKKVYTGNTFGQYTILLLNYIFSLSLCQSTTAVQQLHNIKATLPPPALPSPCLARSCQSLQKPGILHFVFHFTIQRVCGLCSWCIIETIIRDSRGFIGNAATLLLRCPPCTTRRDLIMNPVHPYTH